MDALSRGLKELVSQGKLVTYSLPRHAPTLCHLAFADDLIIFLRGYRRTIRTLFEFLSIFELASGQKANMQKSTFIISKFASIGLKRWIKEYTGIPPGSLPMKYLGINLFKGRRKIVYFQSVIDKFKSRLSGWQSRMLTPGGRII